MQTFVIITVSLINLFIAATYFRNLYRKRSKPALAMWLFFSLAVTMSLITYLKEGNFGFWDNVLNTTDLVLTIFVTIAIFFMGDKSSRFNRFDMWCLVAVIAIVVFWLVSQNHLITNLGIQLILVIAYFPVVKRMLTMKENTEPFAVWIALMIAPMISLITSKGTLAAVYAIRAIICTGLLLALMIRIEWVKRKEPAALSDTKM
ncbi:MAG: hypothetical protein A2W90_09550 [Bacteroidetes bacterium GWF2_42_66]|nr:MAG: hypothetical protein A2W92_17430 [Bacteroidetes bacterium GWA2_42_15]OFX97587.1 MAG: hypothetical protein A2W89_01855 [Bacteroidetes bacterium GWE2_42_39]OFY43718.1 MAG: hypothetical protein A2W90_09550 [Bacteroidetes bacterium GWF2_42_66]HBL76309.1 hypothetical protein [Prolixibacteraceae bacterium]HCR89074.1 hypothetical protein [Prolixibacteraceae bacterium]